jgi:hypothetical protein
MPIHLVGYCAVDKDYWVAQIFNFKDKGIFVGISSVSSQASVLIKKGQF